MTIGESAWARGRLDGRRGPSRLLFGSMFEDASIELAAFAPGGRVFCIASAGCTAMKLAPHHPVVAVDINPVQLAYAARRFAGAARARGRADHVMAVGRVLVSVAGWRRSRLRAFLDLEDPSEQAAFWRRHLDTPRFRFALDALLSVASLRIAYAPRLLDFLPRHLAAVMRARMERGFSRHPNRANPYARELLLGDSPDEGPPVEAKTVRLVHSDAAAYLERSPAGSFDGFSLSNILDGADESYARRLFAAVRGAAAPGAVVVRRSFAEADPAATTNRAAEDRAMIWGLVDVRPASALEDSKEARRSLASLGRSSWAGSAGVAPRSASLGAGETSVVTRTTFAAPRESVWDRLTLYEQVATRPPFHLRALLPTPIRAEGRMAVVGDEAKCSYHDGHLVKRVTRVIPGRSFEFEVVEQNLVLGGGIRLEGGSYTMHGLRDGLTEVALTTRFVSPRRPRWLWSWLEEALCHSFHRHILDAMRHGKGRV